MLHLPSLFIILAVVCCIVQRLNFNVFELLHTFLFGCLYVLCPRALTSTVCLQANFGKKTSEKNPKGRKPKHLRKLNILDWNWARLEKSGQTQCWHTQGLVCLSSRLCIVFVPQPWTKILMIGWKLQRYNYLFSKRHFQRSYIDPHNAK